MQDTENILTPKRRRRIRMLLFLLGVFVLFLVLLLRIWFSSKAVELAYEIDRLAAEKETLEEENRRFVLQIAALRSPERISRIAVEDLKMVRPADAAVIFLKR